MNLHKTLLISLLIFTVGFVQAQAQSKSKPKPERPYVIHERGQYMTKINVIKNLRSTENAVQIEAVNLTGGIGRIVDDDMPGAEITDVGAFIGSFNAIRKISKSGRGETIQLTQVVYPIKLRITISQQVLELELKEEGYWKISVGLNK